MLVAPKWARVHRMQLIRREVREYLPDGAIDLLLDVAEPLLEGNRSLLDHLDHSAGPARLYATLMVTIDLRRAAAQFREPADDATALRVAELLEHQPTLKRKLLAWIEPSLETLWGEPAGSYEIAAEISLRHDGPLILIDVDLEADAVDGERE